MAVFGHDRRRPVWKYPVEQVFGGETGRPISAIWPSIAIHPRFRGVSFCVLDQDRFDIVQVSGGIDLYARQTEARPEKMRVVVDHSRQHHSATQIDDLRLRSAISLDCRV